MCIEVEVCWSHSWEHDLRRTISGTVNGCLRLSLGQPSCLAMNFGACANIWYRFEGARCPVFRSDYPPDSLDVSPAVQDDDAWLDLWNY
jgi:hypothetical protein